MIIRKFFLVMALFYVDEKYLFLIESHIEGMAYTVQQYEQDKKLRFMVMRPRPILPP
jgi:hypothetical protein